MLIYNRSFTKRYSAAPKRRDTNAENTEHEFSIHEDIDVYKMFHW